MFEAHIEDIQTKRTRQVKGKFSKKIWLQNSRGKRITPKIKHPNIIKVGTFGIVRTSNYDWVYNENKDEIICSGEFVDISKISDSLYFVTCCDKYVIKHYGLYDTEGTLISKDFTNASKISNGYIAVEKDGKWGFIDEKSNCLIIPSYEHVSDFYDNGIAIVNFKGRKRIAAIDKTGSFVFGPLEYKAAAFLTDNLFRVYTEQDKVGVIDITGKVVINPEYKSIILRSNSIIVHSCQGKYGLKDLDGNDIFECIYSEIIETEDKFVVHDFAKKEVYKVKEVDK